MAAREYEASVRNAVRAVIENGPGILLLRKQDDDGSERYALPGGAQDPGETLLQALQRECLEEIGSRVQVHGLYGVGDYYKQRGGPRIRWRHQVEFLFRCSVPQGYRPMNGPHPDKHQVEVVWMERRMLDRIRLLPQMLVPFLQRGGAEAGDVYLGLID